MNERVMLLEGDVLEAMRLMPSESCDCLYSDVPYGLGPKQPTCEELIAYLQGAEMDTNGDFMGKRWAVPSVAVWREAFRVLKPGAPLLVNAAPRTQDLVAIGMRAAGFEIADVIAWMFAEAMVKNYNLAKSIDSVAKRGTARPEDLRREQLGADYKPTGRGRKNYDMPGGGTLDARPSSPYVPATELAKAWAGHGTALAPGYEPIILAWKPNDGTYVENITKHGVGGLNVDGTRIGDGSDFEGDRDDEPSANQRYTENGSTDIAATPGPRGGSPKGRWPKNLIMDEGAGAILDATVGDRRSTLTGVADPGVRHANRSTNDGTSWFGGGASDVYADSGGPSRFFYCAKSSRAERDLGCDGLPLRTPMETVNRKEDSVGIKNGRAGAGRTGVGVRNHHPSVKPVALCKYLATLMLPPPGATPRRLLNIYSGSGSDALGAILAGWDEIVCVEREPEYATISKARFAHAIAFPHIWEKFMAGEIVKGPKVDPKQVSLFDAQPAVVSSPPPVVTIVAAPPPRPAPPPTITAGIGSEMPFSELSQKLAKKGWEYTIQEIASWEPEKRARAAKWVESE